VPRRWHLSHEEQRARYLLHENTIDNAGYVERFNRFIALLRENAPPVRLVLDYGCGPAPIFVELLRRAGYDAVGYDPFFAPDADLSHPFDAVVSIETFEHFSDPKAELTHIASLLWPGGRLAIMTMFHKGAETLKDWWYIRDPTHVAFYSPATFRFICSNYGFHPLLIDNDHIAILGRKT